VSPAAVPRRLPVVADAPRAAPAPVLPGPIGWRPKTRGDCGNVPRPCPFAGCRHHNFLEVRRDGSLRLNHPHLEDPSEMTADQSCSLDVADANRQGMLHLNIAPHLGHVRQRMGQLEVEAIAALRGEVARYGLDADSISAMLEHDAADGDQPREDLAAMTTTSEAIDERNGNGKMDLAARVAAMNEGRRAKAAARRAKLARRATAATEPEPQRASAAPAIAPHVVWVDGGLRVVREGNVIRVQSATWNEVSDPTALALARALAAKAA